MPSPYNCSYGFAMKIPLLGILLVGSLSAQVRPTSSEVFGEKFPKLDRFCTGEWWKELKGQPFEIKVPREEVIGFGIYTVHRGTLKMTAQLFPLLPDEEQVVRLEIKEGDAWKEIAKEEIQYPGWSAHFRVDNWDSSKSVPYRLRHGKKAEFTGTIRKDPRDKDTIVVANMSCNSSRTTGPRPLIVKNLLAQDPDLLFFAGDQTYRHTTHTVGWLEFGMQFRDVLRDRPAITIPDDHDVGQANLWGAEGIVATNGAGNSGGYFYPVAYINMVQRQQTWHLPDPVDPAPVKRGIGVYFTHLTWGGVDFAILEDRKFKSGPLGNIPKMGPRPDHINDPSYERAAVDLPHLVLLGDRQLKFLNQWSQDWTGADMKAVLSQTAFCGAVHMHGGRNNRLLADLDSNAWPQKGRNKALVEIRRAWAPHLCGDQHLAVAVKHGIDSFGDGPYAFTSPALVNTIYGRWWHPEDEKAGPNPVPNSPLPWTGDYLDGLGNHISMLAYANPEDARVEKTRGDGYGVVRFQKKTREVTFECYRRFADVTKDAANAQFAGWPMTVKMRDNDGRKPVAHLKAQSVVNNPVIQVTNKTTGDILYTVRWQGREILAPIYSDDEHELKVGLDLATEVVKAEVVK
jgi:3',5'-cyclic AMP phosphodiesterase CpdA